MIWDRDERLAFDVALQAMLKERSSMMPWVEVVTCAIIEHRDTANPSRSHGFLLAPRLPLRVQPSFLSALEDAPPVWVRPSGAKLLHDFAAMGESFRYASDLDVYRAGLDVARLSGMRLSDARHLCNQLAVGLVARTAGARIRFEDLPNIDYAALARVVADLDAKLDAQIAARRRAWMGEGEPVAAKPDPVVEAAALAARRSLDEALR